MGNLKTVLRFAWRYMRPYWPRLVAGIVLGCVCGVLAGSFIWATRTLAQRLQSNGATTSEAQSKKEESKLANYLPVEWKARLDDWKARTARLKGAVDGVLDDWLPRAEAKLSVQRILGGLLFLPLLVLLRGAADYLSSYCMGWVGERVINDLRFDVLSKLTGLSLDYFTRATTGDMLTRINADTMNLHRALRQGTGDLVKESVTMLSVLAYLTLIDWTLTSFVLVFFPVVVLPLIFLGRKARRAGRESRKANVGQNSLLVEVIMGIRVVKAFNLESRQLQRFREFSKKLVHHGMKNVQAKELANPVIEVIAAFGVGALIVYLFWSRQTLDDLVTFVTGVIVFFNSVKRIAGVHILFEQANAGIERLVELLKEKPSISEPAQPKSLKTFEREIRFENVSFSYGDKLVVRDVNLSVPRGFKLGIAGESGSGKSTLVNLLFRFYDVTSGAVKIDGLDVRDLSFADLRQHMALVSQDVFVFRTTVAENIAAGNGKATREEIERAARAAHAHDFISQLPNGYDTVIGERGMTLSGGQRQRLAIARAFVRNAPILVLDEATASLDSQSEAEVQAAIDLLEENRTVICVAHRLSTLAEMDQIIVLSEGRVVEQGTFGDLLRARGTFASMAARQGMFPPA